MANELAWAKIWKDNSYRSYWTEAHKEIFPVGFKCPNCKTELFRFKDESYVCRGCTKIICEQCLEGNLTEQGEEMVCLNCKSKFPKEIENEMPKLQERCSATTAEGWRA